MSVIVVFLRPLGLRLTSLVRATKRSLNVLRDLGWSADEAPLEQADGSLFWQIDATRHGHTILAWGRTKAQAWEAACRLARRVHARESNDWIRP